MTRAVGDAKTCCALAYADPRARSLLGDSFHPGGVTLTAELARALDVRQGSVVADIASGPGTSALHVAAATGCAVVGIDLARTSVKAATGNARRASLAHLVRFVCADAEALPLADASVDGVLCECALCLFADKAAAAREIARILRPGARLVLSDVTAEPARLPPELRTLDAYVACLAGARPLDETAALLHAAGLRIERVESRDDAAAELLERIEARLRVARLLGGGPLNGLIDRADALLHAARDALRDRVIGYGIVVARRVGRAARVGRGQEDLAHSQFAEQRGPATAW